MASPSNIAQIFDQCLVWVAAGASVESCLAQFPDFADELRLLLTRAEEDAALHRALSMLNSEELQVLALYCFGDRTLAQIAILLDDSEPNVEAIQQRAVNNLARALNNCIGEARQYGA
jgi:DNA-directed RNA polymerase specialized sigma24 family protein